MGRNLREIDDLISDDDYQAMKTISDVKKQLISYFDRKKLLDEMISIVDSSECLTFSTDRSKRFISPSNPVFKLKLSVPKAIEMYGEEFRFADNKNYTEKETVDFRMSVIYKQVITPFGIILNEAIENLDPALLNEIPTGIELAKFILTSIFQVKTELDDPVNPICYIEYTS